MKILYIVPGIMARTELGGAELERRKNILQQHARKDTTIGIIDLENGPESIESAYEEYLSVPGSVDRAIRAEKDGYHGLILGCFGDPGLDALREMVAIPVVGPGETAMQVASMLGTRFSIVTVMDSVIPSLERMVRAAGMTKVLASVRAVNIPVLALTKNRDTTLTRIEAESLAAVEEDKADVIVLGCMSMAFMEITGYLRTSLGIPVVNPALVSLAVLEGLVHAGLAHSKKTYPF